MTREQISGFTYETRQVRIVFAPGASSRIPDELARLGLARALVISTPGRADAVQAVVESLGDGVAGVFDRARVHVPAEVVAEAREAVRRLGPDACIAVGGGSAIGLAKAVALETGLPILAVPTTYSGSEMTAVWGVTDGDRKRTGRDDRVAPVTVVYDPLLTAALPPGVSAASGMNAVAHCVEALYAVDASPIASLLAEEGIRLLAGSLPRIVRCPDDLDARSAALHGAHLAGRALDMTSMALHHKLCHVLGGTFGLPHALTHAVLLPHVAAFNAPAAPRAMRAVARALNGANSARAPEAAEAAGGAGAFGVADAVSGLFGLSRDLGITETLGDLGLAARELDRAADLAVQASYPNPRPVTREGVRQILEAAWREGGR